MFNIEIIKKEQQLTSNWAGGTTTQISIYPKESNYANRDFLWRLSTAVVELEESTFTRLPGFDRHLMVLEGGLKLIHSGHHTVNLKQFQQDSFKGEWETLSIGKARDFNLMLREGIEGQLEHFRIDKILNFEVEAQKENFFSFYCYKGQINMTINKSVFTLTEGNLALIYSDEHYEVIAENNYCQESNIIAAHIVL